MCIYETSEITKKKTHVSRIVEEIPRDQDAIFARTVSTGMPTLAVNRVPARKRTRDFQALAPFSPTRNRSAFANLVRNLSPSNLTDKHIHLDFFVLFYHLSASLQGYTGRKCERCSPGYYGFPHLPAGKCTPCECNPAGSLNDECDTETGQCRCRAGSTGRDCSECTAFRHVFINNVCTCKKEFLSLHIFELFPKSSFSSPLLFHSFN